MKYINVFPIFWHLENNANYTFINGVPSVLNEALSAGQLNVSPVSSLEYMNRSERYRIMPGIGLSTKGPVNSVLFCSKYPIQELCGKKVYMTADSLTAASLAKLVLETFMNTRPQYVDEGEAFDACLIIGDKALKIFHSDERPVYTYDLGEIWYKFTGFPFVYSLWLVSANSENDKEVKNLYNEILAVLPTIHSRLDFYADEYIRRYPKEFTKEQLVSYWNLLNYQLGDLEMDGLVHFYRMLGYDPKWHMFKP